VRIRGLATSANCAISSNAWLVLHGKDEQLLPEHLPKSSIPQRAPLPVAALLPGLTLRDAVRNYERDLITQAMQKANGVQTAAEALPQLIRDA